MINTFKSQKVLVLKLVNRGLNLKGVVKTEVPKFQDHLSIRQAIVNKPKVMP